ncbi:MAG: DNA polymerase III subunit beta [Zetaproteobacteria bacterium]|nr:DNA polymerase III subunit beta [Pseudobdellovibrionaceae bacterium]
MKILIEAKALKLSVSRLQGALVDKSFAQIGLLATNKNLCFFAADRVLAIYSTSECDSLQEGRVFVPAKIFTDVVREVPQGGKVSLEEDGAFLKLSVKEGSTFTMKTPTTKDAHWQDLPSLDDKCEQMVLPTHLLSYMLSQTVFCITEESPRAYGTVGFLHKLKSGQLCLVGTDGFRLSQSSMNFDVPGESLSKGICLSKRALSELLRMCNEDAEEITISVSGDRTRLIAETKNYQAYILLSAVKYPRYQSVLPKKQEYSAPVPRVVLQGAIKRVLLASDKTGALQINLQKEAMILSSKTLGSTEGREKITLSGYNGSNRSLAVKGKFLADIFSNTAGETVQMSFGTEDEPVSFYPQDEPEGCLSKHILVPIKETE